MNYNMIYHLFNRYRYRYLFNLFHKLNETTTRQCCFILVTKFFNFKYKNLKDRPC